MVSASQGVGGMGTGGSWRQDRTDNTHLPFQAAAPRIMVRRHPCMMAAALLPRVGPGTPTTLTRRHGEDRELGVQGSLSHRGGVCLV